MHLQIEALLHPDDQLLIFVLEVGANQSNGERQAAIERFRQRQAVVEIVLIRCRIEYRNNECLRPLADAVTQLRRQRERVADRDRKVGGDVRAIFTGAEVVASEIGLRSEEHTSELQSLMRISYAVFCLKKKI